jgi:hypothetical protein
MVIIMPMAIASRMVIPSTSLSAPDTFRFVFVAAAVALDAFFVVANRKNSATRLCWSIGIGGIAMTP